MNDFEYIQYDTKYKMIKVESINYHPYGCRLEYEHSGTEWFHPKGTKKLSYGQQCGHIGTLGPVCKYNWNDGLDFYLCWSYIRWS